MSTAFDTSGLIHITELSLRPVSNRESTHDRSIDMRLVQFKDQIPGELNREFIRAAVAVLKAAKASKQLINSRQ